MRNFKNLRVWHLAQAIDSKAGEIFPEAMGRRRPGLRAQALEASHSIPSNIAEGCGCSTEKAFLHFIDISIGSLLEFEGHLKTANTERIVRDVDYGAMRNDLITLTRMLNALRRTLLHSIALEENAARDQARRKQNKPVSDH